jgi:uncharacterized metal-binding protein YceD (DUF177 family)
MTIFALLFFLTPERMKSMKEFTIPFLGLKHGRHVFTFEVKDKFFEAFDFSEIHKADIHLEVDVDKQSTMLVLDFKLHGTVMVMCDRCGDEISQAISGENKLVIKFGEQTGSTDFDVFVIGPGEAEVNIAQFIYEFTHLALPARRVHEKMEECNQDVLMAMNRYLVSAPVEEESDEDFLELDNQEEEE